MSLQDNDIEEGMSSLPDFYYDESDDYSMDNLTSEEIAAWLNGAMNPGTEDGEPVEFSGWSAWVDTAFVFGCVYVAIGTIAIIVNASNLYVLMRRRSQLFAHVFYVMIFNFALIDTVKGICSILFSLKLLKPDMNAIGTLWVVKIDQMSGILLRFSNLATILNLLMITINEYLFICYPLQYPCWVTKLRVYCCIATSWVVSLAVTIVNSILGMSHRSILIDQECQMEELAKDELIAYLSQATSEQYESLVDYLNQYNNNSNKQSIGLLEESNYRSKSGEQNYRQIETQAQYLVQLLKQLTNQGAASESDPLKCILQVDPSRSSHYIYHFGIILFCIICLAVTACSYFALLRVVSRVVKADLKHNAEMAHLNDDWSANHNGEQRRLEKDIVKRHKYVVVIGTVIFVYSLYLTAYAVIQLLQLINMSQSVSTSRRFYFVYVKYVCYTLISLHSFLQPLCYLRMKEFRLLLKRTLCGRKRKPDYMTENLSNSETGRKARRTMV